MTEEEAAKDAYHTTEFCHYLAVAWDGEEKNSICLQRIFLRDKCTEEIRMASWKDGFQMLRPAELRIDRFLLLLDKAVENDVIYL